MKHLFHVFFPQGLDTYIKYTSEQAHTLAKEVRCRAVACLPAFLPVCHTVWVDALPCMRGVGGRGVAWCGLALRGLVW